MDRRWNYWHMARPLMGAVLGIVAFFIFVGVINATVGTATTRPLIKDTPAEGLIVYSVVAFVVGYREETFREPIKRAGDLLFKPATPGEVPTVTLEPPSAEFGPTPPDGTSDADFELRNRSGEALTVAGDGATTNGDQATEFLPISGSGDDKTWWTPLNRNGPWTLPSIWLPGLRWDSPAGTGAQNPWSSSELFAEPSIDVVRTR